MREEAFSVCNTVTTMSRVATSRWSWPHVDDPSAIDPSKTSPAPACFAGKAAGDGQAEPHLRRGRIDCRASGTHLVNNSAAARAPHHQPIKPLHTTSTHLAALVCTPQQQYARYLNTTTFTMRKPDIPRHNSTSSHLCLQQPRPAVKCRGQARVLRAENLLLDRLTPLVQLPRLGVLPLT